MQVIHSDSARSKPGRGRSIVSKEFKQASGLLDLSTAQQYLKDSSYPRGPQQRLDRTGFRIRMRHSLLFALKQVANHKSMHKSITRVIIRIFQEYASLGDRGLGLNQYGNGFVKTKTP